MRNGSFAYFNWIIVLKVIIGISCLLPTCCSYRDQKIGNAMKTVIALRAVFVSVISVSAYTPLALSNQWVPHGTDEVSFVRNAYWKQRQRKRLQNFITRSRIIIKYVKNTHEYATKSSGNHVVFWFFSHVHVFSSNKKY